MRRPAVSRLRAAGVLVLAVVSASACGAIKRSAIKSVADTLSTGSGDVFTRDDDPELVRDASPFGLKMYESLLESIPRYVPLLTSTCANFTQYAYAFVQADVDLLDPTDYAAITKLEDRAFRLYMRARGYCVRGLEERRRGTERALQTAPEDALAWAKKDDVPLLYWSGASWGSAISLGLDKPELILDVPAVQALMARALALDEGYAQGAIHAALISIDARPEMGGSPQKARAHFARAVELSKGLDPGPYVALAVGVSKPERNREEFVTLLEQALAIDPERNPGNRLVVLMTQARARRLLERVDDYFPRERNEAWRPR
jgi:predicted anti-sigma-YlaC factor YlaD